MLGTEKIKTRTPNLNRRLLHRNPTQIRMPISTNLKATSHNAACLLDVAEAPLSLEKEGFGCSGGGKSFLVLLQGGLLIGVAFIGGTTMDLALACTGLGVDGRGSLPTGIQESKLKQDKSISKFVCYRLHLIWFGV